MHLYAKCIFMCKKICMQQQLCMQRRRSTAALLSFTTDLCHKSFELCRESVIFSTFFLLHINDLFTTSNLIHNYVFDCSLHATVQYTLPISFREESFDLLPAQFSLHIKNASLHHVQLLSDEPGAPNNWYYVSVILNKPCSSIILYPEHTRCVRI